MTQILFQQADALHRQGKLPEAERLYRQILAAGPAPFPVHYMLAAACYQQQRTPEALAAIDTALALEPRSPDALMLRAVLLMGMRRFADALGALTSVSMLRPGQADVWHNRGAVLSELGRLEDAVNSFDKALALQPTAESWNDRGAALQKLGRMEEAVASFDRALALKPGSVWSIYNRGTVLLNLQRFEDAVAAFDAVLAQNSNAAEAWNNRGIALQGLSQNQDALASYDQAVALRSDFAQGWHNRGGVLHRLKRHEEAIASYDKVVALAPAHADAWNNRAAALRAIGRFEEALAGYRHVIELQPDDGAAWGEAASLLGVLSRFDEALEYSEKALVLQPDHPATVYTRATILWESGRIAEGLLLARHHAGLVQAAPAEEDPPHKRRHDAEQADYLAAQGIAVAPGVLHITGGGRLAGPAINPANAAAIAAQWRSRQPQIVVIDDLLTPEGLKAMRDFCWGSTIWRKPYKNGYLGAMPAQGFACPLLAQIAEELCATFPDIFQDHGLVMLWGFKYDSSLGGIRIHADQAAVNVNFWITPDEANRNPDKGGLVIWDVCAPQDWDISKYNGDDDAVRAFLAETGSKPVTVPYRANRAVIFDSDLFHETDEIEFEEGYLNRRINLTMLFGRRNIHGR